MFTGIIETFGVVSDIKIDGKNFHFTIESGISDELKIDQSLAHDGVCLTVVAKGPGTHTVTAIDETMIRSNLRKWKKGYKVNLERAMKSDGRLDGHIVQGHVDTTARVMAITEQDGSWYYTFQFKEADDRILVDKGSVCVNGISLTVVEPDHNSFKVAIIPYTYEHTNFQDLNVGDVVNLEFDILGKYILKMAKVYMK